MSVEVKTNITDPLGWIHEDYKICMKRDRIEMFIRI